MSSSVEGFGCRPIAAMRLAPWPASESLQGNRAGGAVPRALIYRGLTLAAAVICQHNFCVMARTLLMVENSFLHHV
jgi:hypothetical protein